MALRRALMVLLLIGGTASAKRRPPPPDLDEMGLGVAPHMRPPPRPDEHDMMRRRLKLALGRASTGVQACASRFRMQRESLDVRLGIGLREPTISVPRIAGSSCVQKAIDEALRATFGARSARLANGPPLVMSYRFTLHARNVDDGYAQPPP